MNNENNIKRDDKLDLVSMIIGIVTLPIILLGLLFDVILFPIFIAPIVGFIFGVVSKNKNKKRTIGIVLNSITFVLMFILFIGVLLAMSTDSQVGDDYEANKTFTNLSMYIPEDWMEAEEEDWGFDSAKTYVYRNFEYIDNWENTDLEADIIKGGEKNKKSLCEITIKDYSESYKMYESFTNQNYSDLEKYKLNKESFDISKNDILLEEKLTKKEFNDIEFEYAVDKSTNSKTHYYYLDAGNNGLYEIVIWDMKNCDKYIKHIEESFELDESSSNDDQINNETTENNNTNNDINEVHIDLNIQDYITLSSTDKDKSTYKINIYNALKNINISEEIANLKQEKEYNVNFNFVLEQYNFNIKINKGYYGIIYYDLYVNDKKLINDAIRCQEEENITINVLGDYIIMRPHFITDIDQALNIIYKTENGLQVKNIFELDENEGMRIRKIDITNNGIILEGSRMYHGPSVVYNKIPYMLLYKEDCEDTKNLVPKDLVVFAKYNYKYENGVLNLVPEVTNLGTFEQELLNNDRYCQNR